MDDENVAEVQAQPEVDLSNYVPKDRVQDIVRERVAETKRSTEDKVRQELEAQYQQQAPQEASAPPPSMGGMPGLDSAAIESMIQGKLREELQAEQQRQQETAFNNQMQDVANNYTSKMLSGKEHHEDFDEVMKTLNPSAYPASVFLATNSDHTPSVMYELAKNPMKLEAIETAASRDPNRARMMIDELSRSIGDNRKAKQDAEGQRANSPLSRLQHTTANSDSGALTLRDLKRDPAFRG